MTICSVHHTCAIFELSNNNMLWNGYHTSFPCLKLHSCVCVYFVALPCDVEITKRNAYRHENITQGTAHQTIIFLLQFEYKFIFRAWIHTKLHDSLRLSYGNCCSFWRCFCLCNDFRVMLTMRQAKERRKWRVQKNYMFGGSELGMRAHNTHTHEHKSIVFDTWL